MIADPVGDVGLGVHHALLERALSAELKPLILALIWLRQRANRDHDRYHVHDLTPSKLFIITLHRTLHGPHP